MNDPRFLLPFQQGLLDMPKGNVFVARQADIFGLEIFPENTVFEQGFKPISDRFSNAGLAVEPYVEGEFELALVHITRNKVESLGLIARAARMTNGPVLVNGAKTDGIESILKQVKKVANVVNVISKAHGKVFWFYADKLPDWEAAAAPRLGPAGFQTAPGMFSSEKIDQGSHQLSAFFDDLQGKGADLGAGWGYLSRQILKQSEVTSLDLLEADYYALDAAKINIDDSRAKFLWVDATDMTKSRDPFDFVVSNPPFHQARKAEPELGKAFIKSAALILKPSGRFLMVANRQLPYETTLDQYFKRWRMCAQDSRFKIFEATQPRK